MKRLVAACVLFALLLAGCLVSCTAVDRTVDRLSRAVEQASTYAAAQDLEAAGQALEEAHRLWQKEQTLLGALVRHSELDEIERAFCRASAYAAQQDSAEFLAQTAELTFLLHHLSTLAQPTAANIL